MARLHTSPIMASALKMYLDLGFVRDCALPSMRGVEYARYTLANEAIPDAIARLRVPAKAHAT